MPEEKAKQSGPDKIEITVPASSLIIRHARCPNGCLLMDPETPISGHPSIHVKVRYKESSGELYLDPAYGSFEHESTIEIKHGDIAEFFCPSCDVSLRQEEEDCQSCSAPMFIMQLPKGGYVEGCMRKGCFAHNLEVVDLDAQLLRLYEETQMDAYL